jgi:hypothetical protein
MNFKQSTNFQRYKWAQRTVRNKSIIPNAFMKMKALKGSMGISTGLEAAALLVTAGGVGVATGIMIKDDAALLNALNQFRQDGTVSMGVAASAYSSHKDEVKSEAAIRDYYGVSNTIMGSILILQTVLFALYARSMLMRLADYVERKEGGAREEAPA